MTLQLTASFVISDMALSITGFLRIVLLVRKAGRGPIFRRVCASITVDVPKVSNR